MIAIERRRGPPAKDRHQREGGTNRLISIAYDALIVPIRITIPHVACDLLDLRRPLEAAGVEQRERHLRFDPRPICPKTIRDLRVYESGITDKSLKRRRLV